MFGEWLHGGASLTQSVQENHRVTGNRRNLPLGLEPRKPFKAVGQAASGHLLVGGIKNATGSCSCPSLHPPIAHDPFI